jgi:hypothetical protein
VFNVLSPKKGATPWAVQYDPLPCAFLSLAEGHEGAFQSRSKWQSREITSTKGRVWMRRAARFFQKALEGAGERVADVVVDR